MAVYYFTLSDGPLGACVNNGYSNLSSEYRLYSF